MEEYFKNPNINPDCPGSILERVIILATQQINLEKHAIRAFPLS